MNLEQLNEQQRAAVTAKPGPVMFVYAGPGSGKTHVLTHRLAWLVRERGVYPGAIMAVTFTNRAAGEMRNRAEALLGGRLRGARVGTFHSICARILREEAEHHSWTSNYLIYDTDEQVVVARTVLNEMEEDSSRQVARRVLNGISAAKNELIGPKEYIPTVWHEELVARVYPEYQKRMLLSDAMDFDDLLMQTVSLLNENQELQDKYGKRVEHLLVDEFQDTNLAQYELVRLLGKPQNNIFVIGDEDQAIYSWRGANQHNMQRFKEEYERACTFVMEQNYRSTQIVLDAARAVIDRNPNRQPKVLKAAREGGELIRVYEAWDEEEEATHIAGEVERLQRSGQTWRDCAIMYRTNAQSRALEEALLGDGIPYRLVRGLAFYHRREIRDLMSCLRLVYNPEDSVSFLRMVNVPARGIGEKTLTRFRDWARNEDMSLGVALESLLVGSTIPGLQRSRQNALRRFVELVKDWRDFAADNELPMLFDHIMHSTRYEQHLHKISESQEQLDDRLEHLDELRGLLVGASEEGQSLGDFLIEKALVADADALDPNADAVSLLTLHAAKGTEFPFVFIVGLEQGLLPHVRSIDEPEGLAEERRLFYVGITRTMETLYLSWALQRRRSFSFQEPSRFLKDIPDHLLDVSRSPSLRPYDAVDSRTTDTTWERPVIPANAGYSPGSRIARKRGSTFPGPKLEQRFPAGVRVMHEKFGEGEVIFGTVIRDDEIVIVKFNEVDEAKKFFVSSSGLTLLG